MDGEAMTISSPSIPLALPSRCVGSTRMLSGLRLTALSNNNNGNGLVCGVSLPQAFSATALWSDCRSHHLPILRGQPPSPAPQAMLRLGEEGLPSGLGSSRRLPVDVSCGHSGRCNETGGRQQSCAVAGRSRTTSRLLRRRATLVRFGPYRLGPSHLRAGRHPGWCKRRRVETVIGQLTGRYHLKRVWARDGWDL
jgi:hypothetical protein